ncbi:HAD family hydrolase [Rugosimonospora acidiphila]|uniref:HAD family hydrolase n=1 Tax=Rugosimonospora acidiphila TaxID=556531 RepID=A0ABP9S6Q7_9ACTN
MTDSAGVLVVDLDGTLYRGDAPVLAYAAHAMAGLADADASGFRTELDGYLSGAGSTLDAIDGWGAVAQLAERYGVAAAVLDRAFLHSRTTLADGTSVVAVPDGFAALLAELRPRYRLVLATNSPADGLSDLLRRIGMAGAFDRVVSSTGKPAGLRALLPRLLAEIGHTDAPWHAFSVGDHWRNDIEPALDSGAMTGYIDRFGRADGPAHVTAATLTELLPAIREWAADPAAFARTTRVHSGASAD